MDFPIGQREVYVVLKASWGLWQVYPLSSLLYIIMVKSLSKTLEDDKIKGRLMCLEISRKVKAVNHSQFADDTFLFGGASSIIARKFKHILDTYLNLSRVRANKKHI